MNPQTCKVLIVNDVLGTRQEFDLPESANEAMENCVPVATARMYLDFTESDAPIAVVVHKAVDVIKVRWYVTGDPEAARVEMLDVQSGSWHGGLLQ